MTARLNVKYRKIDGLRPYTRNARTHPKKQIKQLVGSIKEFGFINPLLITRDGELIAGHGRWEAAQLAGLSEVPRSLSTISQPNNDVRMSWPTTSSH